VLGLVVPPRRQPPHEADVDRRPDVAQKGLLLRYLLLDGSRAVGAVSVGRSALGAGRHPPRETLEALVRHFPDGAAAPGGG